MPEPTTHLLPASNTGSVPGFARFTTTNPAADFGEEVSRIEPNERLIAWAGWLDDDRADPCAGRFEPDFRLWTATGWDALSAGLVSISGTLEAQNATLCLRPHAGCVLSDSQGCLTFLRENLPPRIELLLDPVALLTPDMLAKLDDHLARAFEALGDQPAVVGCVLAAPAVVGEHVAHAPLAEHPDLAKVILDLWSRSPLAQRPRLVTDPRDASA